MKNLFVVYTVLPAAIFVSCFASAGTADTNERLRAKRENRERIYTQNQIRPASDEQERQVESRLYTAMAELSRQFGSPIKEKGLVESNGADFADVEIELANGTVCNLTWSAGARGEFGLINCLTERNEKLNGSFDSNGQLNSLTGI